jgi:hypothetical protein
MLGNKYKYQQKNGHNKRKNNPDRPFKQIHNFPQFHLKVLLLSMLKGALPIWRRSRVKEVIRVFVTFFVGIRHNHNPTGRERRPDENV